MKFSAAAATILVLAFYILLMGVDPNWGMLAPRGGIFGLGLSLAIANAAIWAAAQTRRPMSARFQLAAGGWIWLIVQGGGLVYVYFQTGAA